MADEDSAENGTHPDSQKFIEQLRESGFFQQITDLEQNLKTIAEDLKSLGEIAIQRLQETESLAAHVIAMEAVLTVILKDKQVELEDVKAVVRASMSDAPSGEEGNAIVESIAAEIVNKARA